VSKFDFTTKLSPALTTMIAISAQAGGADVGVEADALLRWNEGLSDRIMKKKTVKTTAQLKADAAEAADEKQNTDTQQDERRAAIQKALGAIYNSRTYDREAIALARTQNTAFAAEYVQNHEPTDNNAGPAGIIPFEVGIEMEGISGIKIGQAFKINEGIMPAKYDGVVGFIVTGIDHTISGNRWVTNLKAQTIILKGVKSTKTKDKDYVKEKDPETPGLRSVNTKGKGKIKTEYIPTLEKVAAKRPNGLRWLLQAQTQQEGFKPGDLNYDQNNPGNFTGEVGGIKSLGKGTRSDQAKRFTRYATLDDGIKTQIAQLDLIVSGQSDSYGRNPNIGLKAYIDIYCPKGDKANVAGTQRKYTDYIISFFAGKGKAITDSTKISTIINSA